MKAHHYTTFRMAIWGGLLAAALLFVLAVWAFSPIHLPVETRSHLDFQASVPLTELKAKLLSPSATPAIVEFDGMQVLDQRLEGFVTDASETPQPVLGTLMGLPPADYLVKRQLLVSASIPEFGTDQISLMQTIRVDSNVVEITTTANQPTGNLQSYTHQLLVEQMPPPAAPRISLSLEFTPRVESRRLFAWTFDRRLQELADQALLYQQKQLDQLFAAALPLD